MRPYRVYATLAFIACNLAIPLVGAAITSLFFFDIGKFAIWLTYTFVIWFLTLVCNGLILHYIIRKSCEWDELYGTKEEKEREEDDNPPDDLKPA
jgi:hypothetical protein